MGIKFIEYINKSIYRKFIVIVALVSVIMIIIYGVTRMIIIVENTNSEVEEKIDFIRGNTSNQFSNPIWYLNKSGIKLAAEAIFKDKEISYIEITTENGEVLLEKQKSGEAYQTKDIIFFKDPVYSEDKEIIATVTMGYTTYYRNKEILFENIMFVIFAFIVLLTQIVLLTFLTKKLSKPFKNLNEITSKVAKGNLNQKVPVLSTDEIGEFSKSFNNMIEKLETMILQRDNALRELEDNNVFLEIKIDERTQDLLESNQELKLVNQELLATNNKFQETLQSLEKTQKKLIQSEKLASLSVLIAGVSHEINTPIGTSITANTYIEKNINDIYDIKFAEDQKQALLNRHTNSILEASNIIQKSLDKASKLIENLKIVSDLKNINSGEKFYIKDAIDRAIYDIKNNKDNKDNKDKRLDIKAIYEDNIIVQGNFSAFLQIINVFLYNSIIHGFEDMNEGEINIKLYKNEEYIYIEYKDNGKGISKESQKNIFNPFFTTKMGGENLGLGLFIVYELVTLQFDGDVYCESDVGKGSCFIIKIPIEKIGI